MNNLVHFLDNPDALGQGRLFFLDPDIRGSTSGAIADVICWKALSRIRNMGPGDNWRGLFPDGHEDGREEERQRHDGHGGITQRPLERRWPWPRIDELHGTYPFAGSRILRDVLSQQGPTGGPSHVRTLMRRMEIEALYRKPNSSRPAPGHRVYPYVLLGLPLTRPTQVRPWISRISPRHVVLSIWLRS